MKEGLYALLNPIGSVLYPCNSLKNFVKGAENISSNGLNLGALDNPQFSIDFILSKVLSPPLQPSLILPQARGNLLASGLNPLAINQAVQAQLSLAAVAQRQFAQLNQRLLPTQTSQASNSHLQNVPQMFRNFIQNDLKTPEQSSKCLLPSSKKYKKT